jgi:hypothetical protein
VFTAGTTAYNGLFEYRLTAKGQAFVERLRTARSLD